MDTPARIGSVSTHCAVCSIFIFVFSRKNKVFMKFLVVVVAQKYRSVTVTTHFCTDLRTVGVRLA